MQPDLSAVRTVAVAASSRCYDQAREVATALTAAGFEVHTPRFDYDERRRCPSVEEKGWLTRRFLDGLRGVDLLYVVASGGYVGRSVCIEVGFAAALGVPVVLSAEPDETAVSALAAGVVPAYRLPGLLAGVEEAK